MRGTSIEVYYKIEANGLLSESRWKVYNYLFHYGPKTAAEVMEELGLKSNQSGRFTELEYLGVIKENRKRQCSTTKNTATEWIVTGDLPKGKIKSKQDRKKAALEYVETLYDPFEGDFHDRLNTMKELIKAI